ncbi:MAG: hypothetical protein COT88_01470 [Candidatus Colwellbacteria bacterium CG10_big_fil_rev_8_21_14_0_10_41_28]|uniref:VTT domain-containing protein n=1 Tax=Candidatus Colwellbacteria bacterium CG10_big_fil_rev_8_21_14_0_10_41_28 TaxID=1974539 RepID=A0A2H0VH84_9BACT|nr:MAG: hypothetical protein COT88_01470 [Candidatus Colwellbacteria bacterium CG10_big_fil_rev_8_21_14_0_10_41_28]
MISSILETLSQFILATIEAWGYWGVFFLMFLDNANIPIPSEVIMPFSGFLAFTGTFSFWPVVWVGTAGSLFGSWLSYYMAIHFHRWTEKWMQGTIAYETSKKWFEKYGVAAAFWGRLIPGVRTFISFPAGMFKVNFAKFSIYTFIASFIWALILTYPGYYLGENWESLGPIVHKYDVLILGIIVAGGAAAFWLHHGKKKNDKASSSELET